MSEDYSSLRKEELIERRNQLINKVNQLNNLQTAFKLINNSGFGAI